MIREHITDRAHGIDVSHYQESFILDKTFGQIDFAIAKIGEGYNSPYSSTILGDFKDFLSLWNDGVAKVGIRGVYFYQRSGFSWEAQATNVLKAIEKLDVKPHMIWCDVEKGGNTISKEFLADTLRIMDFWKKNAPQYTSGLYANKDILQNYVLPLGTKYYGVQWVNSLKSYPLWYAQYYLTGRSPDRQPLTLSSWSNWDLFQYTDTGDSFKIVDGVRMRHYGSPDLNVYNGTVSEMKSWLKISDSGNETTPDEVIDIPVSNTEEYIKMTLETASGKKTFFSKEK